ncbi:hypothetical protein C5L22_00295 [Pantoea ananatis]|nr:hypothetical protein C5L22_00295 [Pantoea ananatis]
MHKSNLFMKVLEVIGVFKSKRKCYRLSAITQMIRVIRQKFKEDYTIIFCRKAKEWESIRAC